MVAYSITLLLFSFLSQGQGFDLTGEWKGELLQEEGGFASNYYFQMNIKQQKGSSIITGSSHIRLSQEVMGTMQVIGQRKGDNRVVFKEPKILKQAGITDTSAWCLKYYTMTVTKEGEFLFMRGDWTGNTMDGIKCSPGTIVLRKRYSHSSSKAISPKDVKFHIKALDEDSRRTLDGAFMLSAGAVSMQREILKGQWKGDIPWRGQYRLLVQARGYYAWDTILNISEGQEELVLLCTLSTVKEGDVFRMENLYFERSKAIITPESESELNKLKELLRTNPNISIQISGHTDSVGSAYANRVLSVQRAKAVVEYLVAQGIDPNRLNYKGYGESKPVVDNDSPANRAKNRRVEFEITKVEKE